MLVGVAPAVGVKQVPLRDRLIEQIRREGPMPFEEFQAIALYDPDDGFFGSGKLRSVKEGDFLTSPEVSPLFGETLARFVNQIIAPPRRPKADVGGSTAAGGERGLAEPSGGSAERSEAIGVLPGGEEGADPSVPPANEVSVGEKVPQRRSRWGRGVVPTLVEVGAGSGSLLKPLLGALQVRVEAWAVEASPVARRALTEVLPVERVVPSLGDTPTSFSGVVIANELLDNLPVALAVRTEEGWEERWVGVEDSALAFVPHEARSEVAEWADGFGLPCPIGGQVEVQLVAEDALRGALQMLTFGALLLIDYGDTAENLEQRRTEGTLRTYRGHHLGPNPLLEPGETDITCDVNFSALLGAAAEAGAVAELFRQDEFLETLGLRDRIHELQELEWELAREGDTLGQLKARSDRTNAETLLHPRGLGDFRVLIVRR